MAPVLWFLATIILGTLVELFPCKFTSEALARSYIHSHPISAIYVRIWLNEHPDNRIYYIGYAILSFANPVTNMLSAL